MALVKKTFIWFFCSASNLHFGLGMDSIWNFRFRVKLVLKISTCLAIHSKLENVESISFWVESNCSTLVSWTWLRYMIVWYLILRLLNDALGICFGCLLGSLVGMHVKFLYTLHLHCSMYTQFEYITYILWFMYISSVYYECLLT